MAMMKGPRLWFGVRAGIVALFIVNGFFVPFEGPEIPMFLPLLALVVVTLFVTFGFRGIMKSYAKYDWSRPSWFTNPFSGPSHFAHLGSWAFIALGLAETIRAIIVGQPVVIHLLPLAFGLGIYLGLTLFYTYMYEKK